MRRFLKRCAAASVCLLAIASPARATVEGVTFDGNLVDVDPATGATSNARSTGLNPVVGIAFSSSGTLYGMTTFGTTSGNANSLYTINPTSGASTLVGATGFGHIVEGDLAFSPGGTLYGLSATTTGQELFTLDTSTGAGTAVGVVGSGDYSAMAFSAGGTLYVLDTVDTGSTPANLLTVNSATAATLSSVTLSGALGPLAGMYYDPGTSKLIVAEGESTGTDELYSLDPGTGTLTTIGPVTAAAPSGLAGLAVEPGSSPAPLPPGVFAALPCVALLALRRRMRTA